jgi:hypothetical protein
VQVARQEQAFTLGLEAVNAGIESGRLDKEQYKRLRPLVIAVNAYLDDAKASAADVATLEAKLGSVNDRRRRARLQQQLDVARDAFTRAMRSLNAALKAFNAAQQEAGHATAAVRDAVQPVQQLLTLAQTLAALAGRRLAWRSSLVGLITLLQSQGRNELTAEEMEQITAARHAAVNRFLDLTQ